MKQYLAAQIYEKSFNKIFPVLPVLVRVEALLSSLAGGGQYTLLVVGTQCTLSPSTLCVSSRSTRPSTNKKY